MSSAARTPVSVKKEPSVGSGETITPTPKNGAKSSDQGWQDIPLKCYTDEDIKDKRYHIARFTNKNNVDIIKDFEKPVRLHRKDPRNIQFHLSRKEMDMKKKEQKQKEAERERRRQKRAAGIPLDEEDGEPSDNDNNNEDDMEIMDEDGTMNGGDRSRSGTPGEMDMSQVAPEGRGRNFRRNIFKRKTRQINLMDDDKRKLRYEEYYPWVMEDYEGKNVYVGNYEAGASEQTHVLFAFDKDGFKMIPAEKVYRFNPRNKYATLTLEEAEAKMEKKSSVPRWLMRHMEDQSGSEGDKDYRYRNATPGSSGQINISRGGNRSRGLRTVAGASNFNDRDQDHDDLDYDEEFADDEEAPIMDGDEEENKLSEDKVKREMLKAAHFDGGSDAEADANDDLDDLFETEKSRKIDKEGKKLRKVLNKTEGGVYDSDDEDDQLNPYLSKSDLESDDDSDSNEVTVKQEPDETDSLSKVPAVRQFWATNVKEGFVVIKAPSQFLNSFQKGEWLPSGRKRATSVVESPQKRQRTDDGKEKSNSPTPPLANADLNDAGPDGSLVTVGEVLDILRGNPLTTKDLLVKLRNRVSANKDNKQRIISIVKKNLKLDNGKLVLRE